MSTKLGKRRGQLFKRLALNRKVAFSRTVKEEHIGLKTSQKLAKFDITGSNL